jgi:transcriptional regulator with XRE-family HTH domain
MTIARYEQGLYSPKSAQVESIAEALDVSPLFLTYDAETLSVLIDYAQTQANELVNRLKSSVQRLNSKGISKVIEYAELLSTQAEYTSADAEE